MLASPADPDARGALRSALRHLADLESRTAWNAAGPAAQDVVLAVLSRALGAAYEPAETATYSAGGVSHRIGSFLHRPSGVILQLLPGSSFQMGSDQDTPHERPVHAVRIQPLLVGRYPTCQAEWDRIGGRDERNWHGPGLPIEGVTWHEVQDWLTRAGGGLRLPSESEWEYACRAGTTTAYFWGDTMREDTCWYGDVHGWQTHAPALHADRPNAFGLVDVAGNVAEWCEDAHTDYRSAGADGVPRRRRWSKLRIIRGGDGFGPANRCRSARRAMVRSTDRGAGIGFRVARSLPL